MANTTVTLSPSNTDLGTVLSSEDFALGFSANSSNSSDPIESIDVETTLSLVTVDITENVSTANVEGVYTLTPFSNYKAGWVDKNDSNEVIKEGFPQRVVPDNKDLTRIIPDSRQKIEVDYTVTANAESGVGNTIIYTHTVFHDHDSARDFIQNYIEEWD